VPNDEHVRHENTFLSRKPSLLPYFIFIAPRR